MGRVLDSQTTFACFLCHSTAVVHEGEQVLAEKSLFNVGCERCHGPGRDHVEAVRAGKPDTSIYRYRSASAETIMRLCSECHRGPGAIKAADIDRDPDLPRFAGTALNASKCYQLSGGKLSCSSCHNPHQSASHDLASYNRVCRSCHSTGTTPVSKPRVCPVNKVSGCVSCHMPAQSVDFPAALKFHNHRIKVYPADVKQEAAAKTPSTG
jgi:predicted CXXCH cytochrome family protein